MDPWKEYAAYEERRDAVRVWADLEGKSPQMADDLARRYAPSAPTPRNWPLSIGMGVKLAAWFVECWWTITRS